MLLVDCVRDQGPRVWRDSRSRMFLNEFTFMFLRQLKRLCLFTGPLHCSFVATECVRDGRAGGSACFDGWTRASETFTNG